jgi:hypothetical protein
MLSAAVPVDVACSKSSTSSPHLDSAVDVSASTGLEGKDADGDISAPMDAWCDTGTLWQAVFVPIHPEARLGACYPDPTGPSLYSTNEAYLVLDSDGRVIDNTWNWSGDDHATLKQAWLDSVAAQRWPCVAGQTLYFFCFYD